MISRIAGSGQLEVGASSEVRYSVFDVISDDHFGLRQLDGIRSVISDDVSVVDEVGGCWVSARDYRR